MGAKRMLPLTPQEPPRPEGASHKLRTAPVGRSRVFRRPSAKKPRLELSGAQKGKLAPRVPGKTRSLPVRRERYQSSSPAPKTTALPSGERAGGAPRSPSIWKEALEGGTMEE